MTTPERHDGLQAAPLTNGGQMPHEDDLADSILRPISEYWKRSGSYTGTTEWSVRLSRLQDEKHRAQQAALRQTIPGHVRATIGG